MSVLQFKLDDLTEELITPVNVELLPGYHLREVQSSPLTTIRITRRRRQPSLYAMSIWFAGKSNYTFRFKAKLDAEAMTLQNVFYELAYNLVEKRIHGVPSEKVQAKHPPSLQLSDFSTLQLLEEVEQRYKAEVPDWAKLVNEQNRPKDAIKKIA